ncbi:MAG: ATP-binding protein, partial [Candidatus Hydrogenedentes bacterium]|nr:ATP-binding protein [Candidatus Hydrogenedentota bacterium]
MGELQAIRKADFNWVVHPDLLWDDELPDTPGLHGSVCDEIIESARHLEGARPALGRLFLGPAGAGKTHLLAMLRRRAARDGITFVMADLTDVRDFFETLLLGFVVSLQQPDASGKPQLHTLLNHLIGALSTTVDPEDYVRRLAAQKPEDFAAPITDILRNLQRKDRTRTARHGDVIRAAVLLNADNYEVNSIGSTWLQGMEIEDEAKHRYGFSAPRQKASDIVRGLSWLASLRGPSIIAIDQLDPIVAYNRQAARAERLKEEDETVELARKILNDLCNGLG